VVRVLTHHPVTRLPHKDQEALLTVGRWVQRFQFDWQRFIVAACAVFHLGVASALAIAPLDQILNAGTAPVFAISPRYVWAALFALAGAMSVVLLRRRTTLVQLGWWFTAMPLGGLWWTAFVLAVFDGRGSAIGVVVWFVLYGIFSVAGIRIALGKR
jgi:hypothetical protein